MRALLSAIYVCAALGEGAVADRTCRDWFKRFCEDGTSLDHRPRSGCPLQSDIERIKVPTGDSPPLTTSE